MQADASLGERGVFGAADQDVLVIKRTVVFLASNFDLLRTSSRRVQCPSRDFHPLQCFDAADIREFRKHRECVVSAVALSKDQTATPFTHSRNGNGGAEVPESRSIYGY